MSAVLVAVCVCLLQAGSAFADRNFTPRFTTNDTGNFAMAANALQTCRTATTGCVASRLGPSSNTLSNTALNNNNYDMEFVDIDTDATTFDSSSADLAIPAGSTVLWAGLYWGGDWSSGTSAAPNASARNTMRLKLPGAAAYSTITAGTLDDSTLNVGRYQAFADVTTLVKNAGGGTYVGANVQAGRGSDHYAGWALVVAYRDTTQPARSLTIFDGLRTIRTTDPPTDITVSGFTTPPVGAVKTTVGQITWEGDLGLVGDTAALNGHPLSNATNPATNYFNSTITPSPRNPSYVNNFGIDADLLDTEGLLPNNSTSATLRLTTSGDQYLPGVLFFATDFYAPKITQTKTVTDLDGGDTLPGDELEYVITDANSNLDGTDTAKNFVLRDPIPAGTSYVPGSIKVVGAARTDAAGDDTAEYDAVNGRIVARLGTGASAAAGGQLVAGASTEVRFRVKVDPSITDDRTITNTATASYASLGTNTALTAEATATRAVRGVPKTADLSITKQADVLGAGPGDAVAYTLTVHNDGPAAAEDVSASDVIPGGMTFVSSTPGTPTCTLAGATLTCALGTIASGDTRTITVHTTVDAGSPSADHQHQFDVQRVQSDLTLGAGETGSVDVACPVGSFATDATLLVLDNGAAVDASLVTDAVEQDGNGYHVVVTNPTTTNNVQTRVSVVCLSGHTLAAGSPAHTHPLLVSAPVTRTDVLTAGTSTLDLTCGPDQVAIAPSFALTGDPVRVRGSLRNGASGWRFVLDSSGTATAELAIRCLNVRTGAAEGHVHDLALAQHTRTVAVPGGATVTERVECGPDGKGITASYDLDPGLLALGDEPQPVNRDFRITNPTSGSLEARLGLLCLGDRTTTPPDVTEYVNSATVSSATPDPDITDNTSTATVIRTNPTPGPTPTPTPTPTPEPTPTPGDQFTTFSQRNAPIAPAAPPAAPKVGDATLGARSLGLPVSCSVACKVAVTITTAGKVQAGGVTVPAGTVLGRATVTVGKAGSSVLRVAISPRTAKALRRAKVKTITVRVRVNGVDQTIRVKLRRG